METLTDDKVYEGAAGVVVPVVLLTGAGGGGGAGAGCSAGVLVIFTGVLFFTTGDNCPWEMVNKRTRSERVSTVFWVMCCLMLTCLKVEDVNMKDQ